MQGLLVNGRYGLIETPRVRRGWLSRIVHWLFG